MKIEVIQPMLAYKFSGDMENKPTTQNSENNHLIWSSTSHEMEEEATEIIDIQSYGSIDTTTEANTFFQTFSHSMTTSVTITLASIPLALFMISTLYFDLNTTNKCFEHIHGNYSLPRNVLKWVLAGHVAQVIVLHFWYQLTLMLIFTWREFIFLHKNTLWIALLQGCIVSVYKIILFTQYVDFTLDRYRYTGNVVFLIGVVYTGYIVSKKISACPLTVGLKKFRLFKIFTTQYFLGCIIGYLYRYLTIPWFISERDETTKAIIAAIVPLPVITLNVINAGVAVSSSKFVRPGRKFIFISFTTGVSILVFRIMQADVKSINIFTALCVCRGVAQILLVATEKLRSRLLNAVCRYFKRCCCRRQQQNEEDEDSVRLDADNFIQLMLYQHSALIASETYQALYTLNNFYIKPWDAFAEPLIRVAIGSAVNLVTNAFSIFIYVYWNKSMLPTVWSQTWKLHVSTVALNSVMTILYFTSVLLTVFQGPQQDLVVRNCTVPF
jgi:hypothetical protein